MKCPHCDREIDNALVLSARNSIIASRPRPGARGLVRNPDGINKPKKQRAKRAQKDKAQ